MAGKKRTNPGVAARWAKYRAEKAKAGSSTAEDALIDAARAQLMATETSQEVSTRVQRVAQDVVASTRASFDEPSSFIQSASLNEAVRAVLRTLASNQPVNPGSPVAETLILAYLKETL